jgi:hypothetical protein
MLAGEEGPFGGPRSQVDLQLVLRAWKDEDFRQQLITNPKAAIEQEFGIEIPEDVDVHVHQQNDNHLHLILPELPDDPPVHELGVEDLAHFDSLKNLGPYPECGTSHFTCCGNTTGGSGGCPTGSGSVSIN